MASLAITHEKASAFITFSNAKAIAAQRTTAGCGHGIIHKLLAAAIDDLGIEDRTVLISRWGARIRVLLFRRGTSRRRTAAHRQCYGVKRKPSGQRGESLPGRWRPGRHRHGGNHPSATAASPSPSSS